MRIGVATWHMGVATLTGSIEKAVECGARAVSFHLTPQKHQRPDETDAVLALVERHDLRTTCHNELGRREQNDDPMLVLMQDLDDIVEWHKASGRIDCVSFDPASHRPQPGEEPIVEIETTSERLKRAIDRLGPHGIKVAVENWIGNTSLEAFEAIREKVGSEHLGALVDLGHLNIATHLGVCGVPAGQFVRDLPMPILEVHAHSNNAAEDQHRPLSPLSDALQEALQALDERGFDGIVTVEHGDDPADENRTAIRETMAICRRFLQENGQGVQ